MILNAEYWKLLVSHPLHRPIIQIDLCDLNIIAVQALRIDRETVILTSDKDFPARNVFDGLVRSSMTEFQFECSPPK